MKFRIALISLVFSFAVLAVMSSSVTAQNYPNKPIHIIAPFPPGGGVDTFSRVIGAKLTERWGQPVVIDNRPGANSMIGTEAAAKAAPDGYTLLVTISGFTINPSLYKNPSYDPIKDFAPITQMSTVPLVLVVNPSLPVRSVADLIALAKSQPGKLNYASIGTGSSTHLAAELLKTMTGVDIVHVPYKGAPPAIAELVAGQVQMLFIDNLVAGPLVASGRLRAIAVTSSERSSLVPDLSPVADTVPGFSVVGWVGLFAPAGTPPAIVRKIHDEIRAILPLPEVRAKLAIMGPIPPNSTPEAFTALVHSEVKKWAKVVKESGAHAD